MCAVLLKCKYDFLSGKFFFFFIKVNYLEFAIFNQVTLQHCQILAESKFLQRLVGLSTGGPIGILYPGTVASDRWGLQADFALLLTGLGKSLA